MQLFCIKNSISYACLKFFHRMDHKTFDEEVLEKEQLRELKTLSPQELAKEIE